MCGIAGIIHFDRNQSVSEDQLIKMRDSMAHRGPDGAGAVLFGNVGLAHRRLSIIDLSVEASQPFVSSSGRYTIVFNGEIFNYQELMSELTSKGFQFRSKSDTEVLLGLYEVHGSDMLDRLNGMFAFAIYDNQEKTLFAARDRIGIKPFYYSIYNNVFYFASEPKAILSAGVPSEVNKESLNELLLFRYIAGENTVFRHIKRLLPGHSLTLVQDKKPVFKCWWNHSEKIMANRESLPAEPFQWFEETFYSSVNYRTISDVPVGVMLSGGLDSGCVAAALTATGHHEMAAFTVGFDEKEYNEGNLAKQVANQFGMNYHEIRVKGDDLMQSLKRAAWLSDEPLVHQNDAQMLALAVYAKQFVTVLLSGEGGDEFMGGYVRYKTLQFPELLKLAGWVSGLLKNINNTGIVNRFDKLSRYTSNSSLRDLVLLNSCNVYPSDLGSLGFSVNLDQFEYRNKVYNEARSLYPKEPARQAMYLDLYTHMASVLDRNDRMTMGAGIECRVPFMDYRLMEMIPALSSGYLLKGKKGKYLEFNSIAQQLPKEVLQYKKNGFSIPWEVYFSKDEAFNEFKNNLSSTNGHNHFEGFNTKKIADGYNTRDTLSTALIRQLYMFDLWQKAYSIN